MVKQPVSSGSPEDLFVRKTRRMFQEINEQTLDVGFEFMTEKDMRDQGYEENLTLYIMYGLAWGWPGDRELSTCFATQWPSKIYLLGNCKPRIIA